MGKIWQNLPLTVKEKSLTLQLKFAGKIKGFKITLVIFTSG